MLDTVIGTWLEVRAGRERLRVIAVDGKTARGPAGATTGRHICWPRSTPPPVSCSGKPWWTEDQ
jgi:hypothetical protein